MRWIEGHASVIQAQLDSLIGKSFSCCQKCQKCRLMQTAGMMLPSSAAKVLGIIHGANGPELCAPWFSQPFQEAQFCTGTTCFFVLSFFWAMPSPISPHLQAPFPAHCVVFFNVVPRDTSSLCSIMNQIRQPHLMCTLPEPHEIKC